MPGRKNLKKKMTSLDTIFNSTRKRTVTLDWLTQETWAIWFRDSAFGRNEIFNVSEGCVGILIDDDGDRGYHIKCVTALPLFPNATIPLCRI